MVDHFNFKPALRRLEVNTRSDKNRVILQKFAKNKSASVKNESDSSSHLSTQRVESEDKSTVKRNGDSASSRRFLEVKGNNVKKPYYWDDPRFCEFQRIEELMNNDSNTLGTTLY